MRSAYKILIGNPEGKRPMWRWEDNIRMDIRETVGSCGKDASASG